MRYYQLFQGALKEKKINQIFNMISKPERQKVRSFVSKDLDTARRAMEAQISRSFYAYAETSGGLQKSVTEPDNQSQSTRVGGPNSVDPRANASHKQSVAAVE